MRLLIKKSTALALAICFTGPLLLNACQAKPPAASSIASSNADYEKAIDLLYNAATRFEYPKAIEHLEAALAAMPDNAETQLYLIYAYLKRSNFEAASAQAGALKNNLGVLSKNQRLWFEALYAKINDQSENEARAWEKVVAAHPQDRWAWYELSSVQSVMEDYAGAAISAEKALQVEPDASKWEASWIYYLLSKAYYRSGQVEKGIEAAQRGKDNKTTWRSTYFRQSLAELKSGKKTDHEGIVADYIEVSSQEGRNNLTYTYANVALFYHELGDLKNAELYAQKSYNREPEAYPSWALGFAQADNGKADEALALLTKAAEASPNNNYVHAAKGWALYRLGRYDEAQASLKTALANTKRKNYSIEGLAAVIDNAITNPDAPAAPQIPWLG